MPLALPLPGGGCFYFHSTIFLFIFFWSSHTPHAPRGAGGGGSRFYGQVARRWSLGEMRLLGTNGAFMSVAHGSVGLRV